jgi:hypothetical protein
MPLRPLSTEITLSAYQQTFILPLPTSHTPFNDWWARSYSSKLAHAPTYHSPFFSFPNTAHVLNLVTLQPPNTFCVTSRALDHIDYIMVEINVPCLSQDSLMLTGQATKRIVPPFLVLYGLLEGDPSAGWLKSKIVWLSQPLKPNMLLSRAPFRKESGSGSLLISFTLTVRH